MESLHDARQKSTAADTRSWTSTQSSLGRSCRDEGWNSGSLAARKRAHNRSKARKVKICMRESRCRMNDTAEQNSLTWSIEESSISTSAAATIKRETQHRVSKYCTLVNRLFHGPSNLVQKLEKIIVQSEMATQPKHRVWLDILIHFHQRNISSSYLYAGRPLPKKNNHRPVFWQYKLILATPQPEQKQRNCGTLLKALHCIVNY